MMLVGIEGEGVEFLLVSESSHPRPLTNRAKGKNSKKFPSQFFKGSKNPILADFDHFLRFWTP